MADDAKIQQALSLLQQAQQALTAALPPSNPDLPAGAVQVTGVVVSADGGNFLKPPVTYVLVDGVGQSHTMTFLAPQHQMTLGHRYKVTYVPQMPNGYDQIYALSSADQLG
ncbi:MAG: hypothetical protein LAP13_04700 [Acidobacteriia bacterium]|nr:hypothetical protein [Terriglobia bacterium]